MRGPMLSPLEAVHEAAAELKEARVPSPRNDAELLVAHVLGISRSEIYARNDELGHEEALRLQSLVRRRREREPLAYVLGEWGFRRLTLAVDPRVLVPRPETEIVVEQCLAHVRHIAAPRLLDIGTGSGAIALAIADEHAGARVTAVEPSAEALAVARENADRTGLAGRVELVHGELFAGLAGPFDVVVSNPPYVDRDEVEALEPEVRLYEPRGALVDTGATEQIAVGAREVLAPGGWLVVECGERQAGPLAAKLRSLAYEDVAATPDLAGIDRVVEGRLP